MRARTRLATLTRPTRTPGAGSTCYVASGPQNGPTQLRACKHAGEAQVLLEAGADRLRSCNKNDGATIQIKKDALEQSLQLMKPINETLCKPKV